MKLLIPFTRACSRRLPTGSSRQAKLSLLKKHKAKKIILYAPTFSPSLTSAPYLLAEFEELAKNKSYLILCKFHDLMATEMIAAYKELERKYDNIIFEEERNIIKFLYISDLMISDTSSVVYEFLLLDKPVITYKNSSKNIKWRNSTIYKNLSKLIKESLTIDPFKLERTEIRELYHPYNDSKSAERMLDAVRKYIRVHGVPEKRKLSFLRRRKINRIFGRLKA
jgi:CDP-glycerol glycerophosphotransferase (TagB/SpsB family)